MSATTPGDFPPAPVPEHPSQERLRKAEPACRACDLWEPATQVVPGRGPDRARVMLVGEQPGDREDRAGEPFVGPAGRALDEGLERAGRGARGGDADAGRRPARRGRLALMLPRQVRSAA